VSRTENNIHETICLPVINEFKTFAQIINSKMKSWFEICDKDKMLGNFGTTFVSNKSYIIFI